MNERIINKSQMLMLIAKRTSSSFAKI